MDSKKVLIVDDEQIARDRIKRFLKHCNLPYQFQITEACNGLEALNLIAQQNPDILFLDVQMPEINGFDVLHQIETKNFQIIFQTAYDEFAVKAFEESACDYLLKPFSQERFNKALVKAISNHNQTESIKKLESHQQQNKIYLEKISFKKGGNYYYLKTEDIFGFISQDHYTSVFTRQGEHIIDLSIAYLSEHLNPQHFFRCHRRSIVALNQIKEINNTSEVELQNKLRLPVSRIQRPLLINALNQTNKFL